MNTPQPTARETAAHTPTPAALSLHPYTDDAPMRVESESTPGTHWYNRSMHFGCGETILGCIEGRDYSDGEVHGYPMPSCAEAEAIFAEVVKRYNAHDGLVAENARLRAALADVKNTLSVVLESRELDSTVRAHSRIREARDQARSALAGGEGGK